MALERLKRNLRLHPPFRFGPSVRLEGGGAALASQSPRIVAVCTAPRWQLQPKLSRAGSTIRKCYDRYDQGLFYCGCSNVGIKDWP